MTTPPMQRMRPETRRSIRYLQEALGPGTKRDPPAEAMELAANALANEIHAEPPVNLYLMAAVLGVTEFRGDDKPARPNHVDPRHKLRSQITPQGSTEHSLWAGAMHAEGDHFVITLPPPLEGPGSTPIVQQRRERFSIAHELGHTMFFELDRAPLTHRLMGNPGYVESWEEYMCDEIGRRLTMPYGLLTDYLAARRLTPLEAILAVRDDFEVNTVTAAKRLIKDLDHWPRAVFYRFVRSQDEILPIHPNGGWNGTKTQVFDSISIRRLGNDAATAAEGASINHVVEVPSPPSMRIQAVWDTSTRLSVVVYRYN